MNRHYTAVRRYVAPVSLNSHNFGPLLIRETFIKPRLGPVDAKAPISRSCKWSNILLKDCKGNVHLFRLTIRSFTTTSCSLSVHGDSTNFLKDLSNEQPRGPYKPISHPTPRHKRFNLNTYHRLQSKHEVYLTEIPL
jgi:hypothetical protein